MTRLAPFPDADLRALCDAMGRTAGATARRLYLEIHAELEQRTNAQPELPTSREAWFENLKRRRLP